MVTTDENATIERMISEGASALAIRAAVPNVSRTNVYLKIAKFKKHGTVGRVQTKTLGRPRVMSEGVDKFLQGLLAAKPDMELDEMRRHLQMQLRLNVSMSTISRAIARAGIASGRPARARNVRNPGGGGASGKRRDRDSLLAPGLDGGDDSIDSAEQQQQQQQQQLQLPEFEDSGHANDVSVWDPAATPIQTQTQTQTQPSHTSSSGSSSTAAALANSQQAHHAPMQLPRHSIHHTDMHMLDPSLAQSYPSPAPPAAMYHSIYAEIPGQPTSPAVSFGAGTGTAIDVYRSPYAPIAPTYQ